MSRPFLSSFFNSAESSTDDRKTWSEDRSAKRGTTVTEPGQDEENMAKTKTDGRHTIGCTDSDTVEKKGEPNSPRAIASCVAATRDNRESSYSQVSTSTKKGLSLFKKAGVKVELLNTLTNPGTKELQQKLADSASRKKPLSCDCSDLQKLWDALRIELEQVKKTSEESLKEAGENLQGVVNEARDATDKGLKEAMDTLITLEDAQKASKDELEKLTQRVAKIEQEFEEYHAAKFGVIEQVVEKHVWSLDEQLTKHHDDLIQLQASVRDLGEICDLTNADVDAVRKNIAESAEAVQRETKIDVEMKMAGVTSDLRSLEKRVLEKIAKAGGEQAEEVSNLLEELRTAEKDLSIMDNKINEELLSSTEKATQAREKIRSECLQDIKQLQKDLHSVSIVVAQVANIPTRSVEWIVQEASSRLLRTASQQASPGECITLTSQRFEAGGAKGLRFELIRYAESSIEGSDMKDCSVKLFAEKGLRLTFRLYVGDAYYYADHTFDGQEPFSTNRMCLLSEQIRPDNTVRVCLEILEAVFSLEATSSFTGIGVSNLYDDDETTGDACIFTRHVNHRMLDLVQAKVDVMNSRMTRRVEWHIEQASRLPKCFAEGEPMCSTAFQAAGLDGLQLVFYPSGYEGVKTGYCSCFLFCPRSTSLRCWLSIGNQRREAKLAFASDGFYGRTNFCRLDQCTDAVTDKVVVVLEIDEAQQDVTKPLTHQISTSQMASTAGQLPSPRPDISVMSANESTVDSVLKIHKASGHLEDVRQLPSIWTSKVAGDISETLEGFHLMKDLRYKRRPNSRLLNVNDRSGMCSSMSVYGENSPSRLSQRERTPSYSPDHGNRVTTSSMSMYSDVRAPLTARPPSKTHARNNLSSKYAAYMG